MELMYNSCYYTLNRVRNSSVPSAKLQAKMGNWYAKKYLDDQMKVKIVSQNTLGSPKQMAVYCFSLFHALIIYR